MVSSRQLFNVWVYISLIKRGSTNLQLLFRFHGLASRGIVDFLCVVMIRQEYFTLERKISSALLVRQNTYVSGYEASWQ